MSMVFDEKMYELRFDVRALQQDPARAVPLALFEAALISARMHAAPYAALTSGVTFALHEPAAVAAALAASTGGAAPCQLRPAAPSAPPSRPRIATCVTFWACCKQSISSSPSMTLSAPSLTWPPPACALTRLGRTQSGDPVQQHRRIPQRPRRAQRARVMGQPCAGFGNAEE